MLQGGIEGTVHFRLRESTDDLEEVTRMLHEAYAPLAAAGMRFLASHQDAAKTKQRMDRGETWMACEGNRVVGVITLDEPGSVHGTPFYARPEVTCFEQFAVRPSHQGRGIGPQLLNIIEGRAADWGVKYLALDTSEHAHRLIAFYKNLGYELVEYCQWDVTNYRSVVLAKRLG